MKNTYLNKLKLVFLLAGSSLTYNTSYGQSAPTLGTASGFTLFTAVGAFDNIGASSVTGDIGTNVGAFTGFPPGTVVGQIHVADPGSVTAAVDVDAAYSYLSGVTCGTVIGTILGNGQVLSPDVYCLGGASSLNADLILDAQGDPNALFIFKINGALSTSTFTNIILINGASLCNVYWQINGEFILGDNSVFKGTVITNGAITLLEASSLIGRGLSRGGAIALHNNIVAIEMQPIATITPGSSTTFCSGNSVSLTGSLSNGVGSLSYLWSPGGETTSAITVSPTVTSTYTLAATAMNSCSDGISSLTVTVNPLTAAAGTITGTSTICPGQSGVVYSVPVITNATDYNWTLSVGATISAGVNTNSITVDYSGLAASGNITVQGSNVCGNGTVSANFVVSINPLTAAAGSITGTATVCQGQTSVIYSVPNISNATGYNWTLPSGGSISSGANTSSVTVDYSSIATSGNISVEGAGFCGNGTASANFGVTISSSSAQAAGSITGTATVCQGQAGVIYSVPVVNNATGYVWTLPAGATIISGVNTNIITVDYSGLAASGNITVQGTSACGDGVISGNFMVSINPLTAGAGIISGTASVCQGITGVFYSVPVITDATGYIWTLPAGTTISTGNNTNSIALDFGSIASSGNITVQGTNFCGNGTISGAFAVIVNPLPGAAGTITGAATCH